MISYDTAGTKMAAAGGITGVCWWSRPQPGLVVGRYRACIALLHRVRFSLVVLYLPMLPSQRDEGCVLTSVPPRAGRHPIMRAHVGASAVGMLFLSLPALRSQQTCPDSQTVASEQIPAPSPFRKSGPGNYQDGMDVPSRKGRISQQLTGMYLSLVVPILVVPIIGGQPGRFTVTQDGVAVLGKKTVTIDCLHMLPAFGSVGAAPRPGEFSVDGWFCLLPLTG
jgi:hypothetical protein